MSKHLTKEEIIQNKKNSIRKLNNLLEKYINDDAKLRKADLISKWIRDYVNYVDFEETFDPKRNIAYKRGNIIKANLGFNLGSEIGGVHYAIVLDNDNKHSSDTVTVVPLSSAKNSSDVYERDLYIGTEFYELLVSRFIDIGNELDARIDEVKKYINLIESLDSIYDDNDIPNDKRVNAKISADKLRSDAQKKLDHLQNQFDLFTKNKEELDMMKAGSIVKIEQIRTISKMRIWIPKNKKDVLYNISLSQPTMDKINEKIKEYFIFSK